MVSRAVLGVRGLLAALVATGCFDVHSVDTGPIFDDFEDGRLKPSDPNFGLWGCGKFPPPTDQNYKCGIDGMGYQSSHSLYLSATIDDPLDDGTQQHGGAYLETVASRYEDISRFSHMTFAAKLESKDPSSPDSASPGKPILTVRLACKLAHLENDATDTNIFVAHGTMSLGSDWTTSSLALGAFTVPEQMPTDIVGGTPRCLQFLDTIRFSLDAGLPDGKSGWFVLHVDEVSLE